MNYRVLLWALGIVLMCLMDESAVGRQQALSNWDLPPPPSFLCWMGLSLLSRSAQENVRDWWLKSHNLFSPSSERLKHVRSECVGMLVRLFLPQHR